MVLFVLLGRSPLSLAQSTFVATFADGTSYTVVDPNDTYWQDQYNSGAFSSGQNMMNAIAAGATGAVTQTATSVACTNGVTMSLNQADNSIVQGTPDILNTVQDVQNTVSTQPAVDQSSPSNTVDYSAFLPAGGDTVVDTTAPPQNLPYDRGAPPPSVMLYAKPPLVRSGDTTVVSWASANTVFCAESGDNGDGTGVNATGVWNTLYGTATSSPITHQTVYVITCRGLNGSTLGTTTMVGIVPVFQEQ
jgi:hypothetical protein